MSRASCPREIARNHKVVPVSRLDNRLYLAMGDPLNVLALDDVKRITKMDITPMIASERAIVDKLNNLETRTSSMEEIIEAQKQQDTETETEAVEQIVDISEDLSEQEIKDSTQEAPVIKLAT
jgi:type IV pilus assembly protein PilB